MTTINRTITNTLSIVFIFVLLAGATGCSKKIMFDPSVVVPGATGKVKVKKDNNNNFSIGIDIINLAEASRLQPQKAFYLVWMQNEQDNTRLLGQLKTSSSLLSKTLKASLNTVTPYKPLRIFITAEDELNISNPNGQTVLTTGSF